MGDLMPPVTYRYAPEVEAIAKQLILKYHTHLLELSPTEMRYCFKSESSRSRGKTILGKAKKVAGFNAFLADDCAPTVEAEASEPEPIFVIEIAADMWLLLNEKQRVALVDHELRHCRLEQDGEGRTIKLIAPHDIEEFAEIVERHGLWKPDVEEFVQRSVGANPTLFDETKEVAPAATYVDEEIDEMMVGQAVDMVVRLQLGSASMLQRKMNIGFARSQRLMLKLEEMGVVGPNQGAKPRNVLMTVDELERMQTDQGGGATVTQLHPDPDAGDAPEGQAVPLSRIHREMLEPGFAEKHGFHAERTADGTLMMTMVDPPAAEDPPLKVPHTMSELAGKPCSEDPHHELDHRECEESNE